MGTPTENKPFLLEINELTSLRMAVEQVEKTKRQIKPLSDHLEQQEKVRDGLLAEARKVLLTGSISTGNKLADSYILHIGYDEQTIRELLRLNNKLKARQGEFICLILEDNQKEFARGRSDSQMVTEQRINFIVGIIEGEISITQGELLCLSATLPGEIVLPTKQFNSSLFHGGVRTGRLSHFNSNEKFPEDGDGHYITPRLLEFLNKEEHPLESSSKIISLMITGGAHEILASAVEIFKSLRTTNKTDLVLVTDEKQFIRDLNMALTTVYHPEPDLSKPPGDPNG